MALLLDDLEKVFLEEWVPGTSIWIRKVNRVFSVNSCFKILAIMEVDGSL